jgi:acyl-CoA thioesterase FadM
MYVWGRLASVAATAKRRGGYSLGTESRLGFRCLPTDIDSNLHLNNARYMMLADVGRVDIFLRSGVWSLASELNWTPMLGGLQTAFVREIKLWQRFDVLSSIATWEGTSVVGRHRFVLDDGTVAATIVTTAGMYDRRERRFVPIHELMRLLGQEAPPRPLTAAESAFVASHHQLRAIAKGAA